MASQTDKPSVPFLGVVANLFRNLPRLMLTNLLFAVPAAAFFFLFRLIAVSTGVSPYYSVFVLLLTVIPAFPFYAGVTKVTAEMVMSDEPTKVFSAFFQAVKQNTAAFLLHGLIFYVASVFSYVSISLYIRFISQSAVFVGPLIISAIVILFFLFMFFYIPPMTVTFDLPLKYIYKNSFLMSFGELKRNFIGLFGLFILFVISTTFLIACYGSVVAVIIVTAVLLALFVPAIASFIVNSAVFKGMYQMVSDNSEAVKKVNDKLAGNAKETKNEMDEQLKESIKSFEPDDNISDDEYVYFNGRMVKKSVILKMKKDLEESE